MSDWSDTIWALAYKRVSCTNVSIRSWRCGWAYYLYLTFFQYFRYILYLSVIYYPAHIDRKWNNSSQADLHGSIGWQLSEIAPGPAVGRQSFDFARQRVHYLFVSGYTPRFWECERLNGAWQKCWKKTEALLGLIPKEKNKVDRWDTNDVPAMPYGAVACTSAAVSSADATDKNVEVVLRCMRKRYDRAVWGVYRLALQK